MAVFPTLEYMQIKARYPKSVAKIQDWVFNQSELKESTKDWVDPNAPEESKEQFIGLMIQMDPRKLYDIFDSFNINVAVNVESRQFWYVIETPTAKRVSGMSVDRHGAEQTGFHDAFEILEKQLSDGSKGHQGLFGDPQS